MCVFDGSEADDGGIADDQAVTCNDGDGDEVADAESIETWSFSVMSHRWPHSVALFTFAVILWLHSFIIFSRPLGLFAVWTAFF